MTLVISHADIDQSQVIVNCDTVQAEVRKLWVTWSGMTPDEWNAMLPEELEESWADFKAGLSIA